MADINKGKIDDEISDLLKTVLDYFDKEDNVTRERQIRKYRRLKLYWNNASQNYWSEVAKDFRVVTREDDDQDFYDKPVNVFRAFLETIVAALSIQIPAVSCVPDDADNPLDLSTAKAGDKIAELVYKHNNVMFLWLQALYIYCTEGLIACHNYSKEDKKYGTYQKPKYKDEEIDAYVCPNCGTQAPDEEFSALELDEFMPDDEDVELHNEIQKEGPVCLECGVALDPGLQKTKLIVPRLDGVTNHPKSRVCLDVYGGLYIKIAMYAKKQEDTPYLIFSHDTHYSNALEMYPHLREKFPQGGWSNLGNNDPYEHYGRLNTQYQGDLPEENVTIKTGWLRPGSFNILPEEGYKKLKSKFPDGAKIVTVNNVCAEYENESLDDYWTLTRNPLSDFLTHDPLGDLVTNIQDIVSDLISLTLQTIEHGISQTYADPAVVDFNSQRQVEATPGTITAAKPQGGGKNISDGFYSLQTASLSPETFNFYRIIQELGQFVSGALPALFGGQQQAGSSRTASEYAMSKGMALQRLQTPWKMLTIWWKEIFGKVIPMYIKNVVEDEKMVQKDELGNFVNVFIRKAELDGKIGDIELESAEKLPITDEQQADMVMQLMQLNNMEISQALMDPVNIPFIRKVIRIPQFKLPGEDDRQKQLEEIKELLNAEPIVLPPDEQDIAQAAQSGQQVQPNEQPSVTIDMDVDNHTIEGALCRWWLVSPDGRLAKIENPKGYQNVLLHFKLHNDARAMQEAQQQMLMQDTGQTGQSDQNGTSGAGSAQPTKSKQPEKIKGASDARTPIS